MPNETNRETTRPVRLMPDPWFRGNTSARCIGEIVSKPHPEDLRPLKRGERLLGKFILPPFQRPAVWTSDQQIKLIESIWDGLPVGAYVFNQSGYHHATDGWLLDGQQRLTALLSYVAGGFPIYGYCYTELDRIEQRGFESRPFGSIETRIMTEAECRVVYDRLAYGGTPHEPKEKAA